MPDMTGADLQTSAAELRNRAQSRIAHESTLGNTRNPADSIALPGDRLTELKITSPRLSLYWNTLRPRLIVLSRGGANSEHHSDR